MEKLTLSTKKDLLKTIEAFCDLLYRTATEKTASTKKASRSGNTLFAICTQLRNENIKQINVQKQISKILSCTYLEETKQELFKKSDNSFEAYLLTASKWLEKIVHNLTLCYQDCRINNEKNYSVASNVLKRLVKAKAFLILIETARTKMNSAMTFEEKRLKNFQLIKQGQELLNENRGILQNNPALCVENPKDMFVQSPNFS